MRKILIIILIMFPLSAIAEYMSIMIAVSDNRNSIVLPDDTPHSIDVYRFYKFHKDCEDDLIAEFVKATDDDPRKKNAKLENSTPIYIQSDKFFIIINHQAGIKLRS